MSTKQSQGLLSYVSFLFFKIYLNSTFCFSVSVSALLAIILVGSIISPAGFMRLHTAVDIKSLTSAVREAKYSQTQIADGHRMTGKMDEALKGGWCVEGW